MFRALQRQVVGVCRLRFCSSIPKPSLPLPVSEPTDPKPKFIKTVYDGWVDSTLQSRKYDTGFSRLLGEMSHLRSRSDGVSLFSSVDSALQRLVARCLSLMDEGQAASESVYLRQLRLESNAVGEAVARYRAMVSELIQMGKGAEMKPAHRVLLQWYMPLVDEITAEQKKIKRNVAGVDRRQYGGYLVLLPPEKLAVIVLHEVLGMALASGNNGVKFTRAAIAVGQAVRAEINMMRLKKEKEHWKSIVGDVMGKLSSHVVNRRATKALEKADWGTDIEAKVGSTLIFFLLKSAKIDEGGRKQPAFSHLYKTEKNKKIGMLQCHPQVLSMVEAGHTVQESLHLRLLPMLVPPKPWLSPSSGGYISINTHVMRTKGSHMQLELLHNSDVARGLDALSQTQWEVNPFTYRVMKEAWNRGGGIADLPSRQNVPVPPPPPSSASTSVKKEYKDSLVSAAQQNRDLYSQRCDVLYKLQVAEEFLNEQFYFPHNIDFRGRAYPIPPHLNHIGSDVCRGLLKFSKRKPLGSEGLRWLKIHLANLYGKDKLPFDERIAFTEESLPAIRDSVVNPLDGGRWWLHADDPWQCLASCNELITALDSPNPERFLSNLPVHQDGSCNGLQHYAALGRDLVGAKQVDLLKSERPSDVYTAVANLVKEKVTADADNPTSEEHELAKAILPHITRKVVKQTVMTSVYGVTFVGARRQIAARLSEREGLTPEQVGRGSYYLTRNTLHSLAELFTGAKTIMQWLNDCAKLISTLNMPVTWVTPLGLAVMQPYRKNGQMNVRTLVQQVTLTTDNDELPKSAFPPNFVHSLDSTHMLQTALVCHAAGLTFASVHDSYWTHACDIPQMNRLLREQFVLLHGQPILEHLRESFVERFPTLEFPPLPPRGDLQLSDVLHSPYFFD